MIERAQLTDDRAVRLEQALALQAQQQQALEQQQQRQSSTSHQ